jgi:hypothetical protein
MDLKTIAISLLICFMAMICVLITVFIKALFKWPSFRNQIWQGITNGDNTPHLDDFQRTSQLFWSYVLGICLIISFLLWMAFPGPEWHIISPAIGVAFLTCIGLRSLNKHH